MSEPDESELDLYICTVFKALDLAHGGSIGAGWRELSYGLRRAQVAEANGTPGAGSLVHRYGAARDRYARECGAGLVPADCGQRREAHGLTDIQEGELDLLTKTMVSAGAHAQDGRVVAGWRELSHGLERAEGLEGYGDAGGAELIQRYREERDQFAREWGVGLIR